ncbi:MAG: amidohydrolase family protein [Acidobacteria bacterium]|nr:amidohydrolase family protein [Acidobacteriota bacterium]
MNCRTAELPNCRIESNRKPGWRSACFALALLVCATPLLAQEQAANAGAPIAIRGGKVMTITHGTIPNGVVVMENGKITAAGPAASTPVPANARVIDATGMTVYPGIIDAESHLGLQEIGSDQMTSDLAEPSDEIMPHMHVYDAFHAETELIPVTRLNGITNAVVAPAEADTLPGQDSFIQLAGRDRDEMILVRDIALPVNVSGQQRRGGGGAGGGGGPRFPSTRMGVASQLRQTLLDAQDYMRRAANPQAAAGSDQAGEGQRAHGGSGGGGFHRDLKMEALIPYLRGERPVILSAQTSNEVLTAMSIAREFNLKVVLNHMERADDILDTIAAYKVPVIVGSIWTLPETGDRYDAEYRLPAELVKRGVKIAFASYSDTHNARNLPYAAGYSVAYGLPYEEAMKALTINPAEMFGVADKLGSLDPGKTANVVIANGDPLDVKTDVKHVFIAGREIPLVNRQTELRDEYWPKK